MISTRINSTSGRGCALFFFGFLLLLVGLFLTGLILWNTRADESTGQWMEVHCTISRCEVEPKEDKYTLLLAYQYSFNGVDYTGTKRELEPDRFSHVDKAQAVARTLHPGTHTTCRVNPANPSESVLTPPSSWSLLWALIPGAFTALIFRAFLAARRAKPVVSQQFLQQKPLPVEARWAIRIFGLIFFLAGALGLWSNLIRPIARAQAAASWPAVPCTVESSRLISDSGGKSTTYRIGIRYRYHYANEDFLGDRYDFGESSSSSVGWRKEILGHYPKGFATNCHVNPAAPWESVLVPQAGSEWWVAILLLGFMAAGGVIFSVSLRAWGSRTPVVASTPLRDGFALVPENTPVGKFGCMLLVAIFWNTITWTAFFGVRAKGGGVVVVVGLFALVGLGLAAAAIYYLLAIFNPRPVLTLTDNAVRLGGKVDLHYLFERQAQRLVRVLISLDAREEATYRRGTNSVTDRSYFYDQVLLDTREHSAMSQGSLQFTIPPDLMHSFDAPNNKVKWTLRVRGEVPRWPDVDFDFPLTVLPQVAASSNPAPL